MRTRVYQVCIKYSMCDLISDVITNCVWSWDTGKIKASDKKTKKRKYGNKRHFLHKSPSKRLFRHRIRRRADHRGSANIICRIWCISLVCGSALLLRSESRSCIEYLIPTNNIIVLDSYFNFIINLIFDHLVVAYFFGPPCIFHVVAFAPEGGINHEVLRVHIPMTPDARPTATFLSSKRHYPLTSTKLYC